MNKLIRDGMVAVLYSPGYGAGWSTWNTGHPRCQESLFDPEIVAMIEAGAGPRATASFAEEKYGTKDQYFCVLGAPNLKVMWLPEGATFRINEYDGYESVERCAEVDWIVA